MNRATRIGRRQLVARGGTAALTGLALPGAFGRVAAAQDATPAGAAAGTDRQGVITVTQLGAATVHSYTSPQDGVFVNTYVIEGADALVVIDGQLFRDYAGEVADYVEGLGKPVERFVLSHVHMDHWSGFQVLGERFPDVPVYALRSVIDYLEANGPTIVASRRELFGDRLASRVTVPDRVLAPGRQRIAGLTWEVEEVLDAESPAQAVIRFPELETIAVFDLVLPNLYHLFTTAPTFEHWADVIGRIRTEGGYRRLLVGHGEPTDPSTIDGNVDYLAEARRIHAEAGSPEAFAARLKERFPERREPGWVDFSALLLYGAINP